jgi:hypothetical protein
MNERTDHALTWALLILCVLAFALAAWLMPGPSDTEAMQDIALDLRDAQQQARAEIHQAQALAMLAAGGRK